MVHQPAPDTIGPEQAAPSTNQTRIHMKGNSPIATPGHTITPLTAAMDAGDNYATSVIFIEEWAGPAA